jgi:hypothetical protein
MLERSPVGRRRDGGWKGRGRNAAFPGRRHLFDAPRDAAAAKSQSPTTLPLGAGTAYGNTKKGDAGCGALTGISYQRLTVKLRTASPPTSPMCNKQMGKRLENAYVTHYVIPFTPSNGVSRPRVHLCELLRRGDDYVRSIFAYRPSVTDN